MSHTTARAMPAGEQDTIVALATPEGRGALGIIRLSGPDAWAIAARATGSEDRFPSLPPRRVTLLPLLDRNAEPIDDAVVTPWRGPASYTGEDLVEFSCHGGREVLRAVVHRLTELGARPAQPGEFTQRAFLHGKMTLEQAEAVGALIEARTEAAARAALRALRGGLGGRIQATQDRLLELLARIELGLDFVEEEIELEPAGTMAARAGELAAEMEALHSQHRAGRLLREGARVVIAGAPNAGKSTLLNRLLGQERAIVSEAPGTTRDYLDASLDWGGLPVRLYDTAGLRKTADRVEAEGARRTEELLAGADAVLWLTAPPDWTLPPEELRGSDRMLVVENKADLGVRAPVGVSPDMHISALGGEGVEALRDEVARRLLAGYDPGELLLVEQRHADRLSEAAGALRRAETVLREGAGEELAAAEMRIAHNALGEITGTVTREGLLHEIFSRFCIGK